MSQTAEQLTSPVAALAGARSFRDVEPQAIEAFVAKASLQEIPAGSALFRAGDDYCQCVHVMVSGHLTTRRPTGEDLDVQVGDFLGLANYLDHGPHRSTVLAVTRVNVLRISEAELQRLEQAYPSLFNAVNRIIAKKLRELSPDRGIASGRLARPVSSIMKSPVAGCGPDLRLQEAFQLMRERRVGSLVVTDAQDKLLGVLTYAGLAEAVLLKHASPDDSIMQAACETPRTIFPEVPIWKAEEIQQQQGLKYLIVTDADTPVGMVSQSDIVRQLIDRPSALSLLIPRTETLKELTALCARLPEVAAEAQESHRLPSAAVRQLSETHLAIQQRAVELTLEWMRERGHGDPPVGFAVLIMGAGGRREMLLNPDQDNGLVVEDTPESEAPEVQTWFERFGKRFNKNLDRLGYVFCPGEIMARNPLYRKTLARWKQQIGHIATQPTEKAARWSNIVFDFDTLYGDDRLTIELRRHLLDEVQAGPRLLRMMAEDDFAGRPALGIFDRLITTTKDAQGEKIDIKRNGLRIVADAARIFALQNGVAVQNTTERLTSLVRVGKLSDDFSASVKEAFEELLDLLLSHQLRKARQQEPLDKLIDPERLSEQSRGTLRMAMRAVKRLQDRLQDDYSTGIF